MRNFYLAVAIFAACFISTNLSASEVYFQSLSIDQALVLAEQSDKNIFISYGAEWCLPCQMVEESILSDNDVINLLNENFIAVKADFDNPNNQEWFDNYAVSCLPTMSVVNEQAMEIDRLEGSMSIREFMSFLHSNSKHKKVIAASYQPVESVVTTAASQTKKDTLPVVSAPIVSVTETMQTEEPTKLTVVQFGAFISFSNASNHKEKLESILDVPLIIHEDDKSLFKVILAEHISALTLENMANTAKENGLDFYVKS